MSWNYRVFRFEKDGDIYYRIHEAYYEDGKLTGYSSDAMSPGGETLSDLRSELLLMQAAVNLPVLTEKTAVGSGAPTRSTQREDDKECDTDQETGNR